MTPRLRAAALARRRPGAVCGHERRSPGHGALPGHAHAAGERRVRRSRSRRASPSGAAGAGSPCEERASGAFVGVAGLAPVRFEAHFTPAVEIGWRLARAAWGRGYATEAARATVAFAFDELGLEEVVALAVPANARSRAVMDRLGMTHDPADDFDLPELPADSPLRRHVLYRLSAERWACARAVTRLAARLGPRPDARRGARAAGAARRARRAAGALGARRRRRRLARRDRRARAGAPGARRSSSRRAAGAPRSSTPRRARATGDVLLFLHADSRLPRDAYASLARGLAHAGRRRRQLRAALRRRRRASSACSAPCTASSAATASTTATRRSGCAARRSTRSAATARSRSWTTTTSSGAWSARPHALPARPGDDVGPALARDGDPAHGARLVRHPLAVRRRRLAAAARAPVPRRALTLSARSPRPPWSAPGRACRRTWPCSRRS